MKSLTKKLLLLGFILPLGSSLTACNDDNSIVLRIINSEDYIYLQESDEDPKDLVDQFVDYIEENYPKYHGLQVVYDTSDTNETLYSELQTGKSNYDLMNVSDYMAQKIVSAQLAVPLYQDGNEIPNYDNYASRNIRGRLDEIVATQRVENPVTHLYEDKEVKLKDYAVGYMWGTLGILFNPDYFADYGIEWDEVVSDMQTFDSFWNEKYNGTISIKNSMRDTYALGLMHAYEDEFAAIKDYLEAGEKDGQEYTISDYQRDFASIFNRCDQNAIDDVKEALDELKKNIFGLEVDSGKEDIVTGKIGVNLAWSGDAVYSIEQGQDPIKVGENFVDLLYAIPELGSNLWFDAWIMPDCPRTSEQYELAHLFLDFISDPANAYQNMDYTGYTSFIGGDDIVDLTRDWYDIRSSEKYEYVPNEEDPRLEDAYQVYAVASDNSDFVEVGYDDMVSYRHDEELDSWKLYYFVPEDDLEEPETALDIVNQNHKVFLLDEDDEPTENQKTYGDLNLVDLDEELQVVDLSYFFGGTLSEMSAEDMVFYTDEYFVQEDNISVGGSFFCQYPDEDTLMRCAVMRDYGEENNKNVMKMWENFKSDPLPTWAIILFIVLIAGGLALAGYFIYNAVMKKKTRLARKANEK